MTIVFLVIVAGVLLAILSCCKVAGHATEKERQAQRKNPCETCLRWEECNGVDDQCPHKKGVDKACT